MEGSPLTDSLQGRTIQIAGSASKDTSFETIEFSHETVKHIASQLLKKGAAITSTIGDEVKSDPDKPDSPSIIFYWDILETAFELAKSMSFSDEAKNLVKVVSSEKSEEAIPDSRKDIWTTLVSEGVVSLHRISPGWNASACKRQLEEELSDALVVLGGGEGVEHLASLFVRNGKPVLPLDTPIGSSYGDGLGGALILSRLAISKPTRLNLQKEHATELANLAYERWTESPKDCAETIVDLLERIVKPQVFYVRLLNEDEEEFPLVEEFFRDVVDVVVNGFGYKGREIGGSETKEAFLNVEIFKEIGRSTFTIADLTGLRLNCFTEMGYAFGREKKVILTARKGTNLPFDVKAIPCHFWDSDSPVEERRVFLLEFWERNVYRPPLVTCDDII